MLFLASRVLEHDVADEGRLRLLEKLQEREFTPLIRSTRLSCYGRALADSTQVEEMERLIASLINSEKQTPYLPGDIFCFENHVFFLLFGDAGQGFRGMRAGVIYEAQTTEPLRKLNTFCQTISLCLTEADEPLDEGVEEAERALVSWRQDPLSIHQGFIRFVGKQDADSLSTIACRENDRARVMAAKLMEDDYNRFFLRRAREAYAEGYSVNSSAEEATTPSELTVNKLVDGGLLRREVLVSCRETGHTLFSLPSADALAVITISHAWCSECGAAIADEKIEEVFAPTRLASLLLEDGAWLVNRLHAILRELGIAESEIAVEPPAGDGEARVLTSVCNESFLIVLRDGDLTPAFARRAVNAKIETEANHLVVVVTGTIHNEGRLSLQNFAQRLARGGGDFELIIAEGVGAVALELQRAFERVSEKALAEQLCELDSSIGLSVARLITTRFQMLQDAKFTHPVAQLVAPDEQTQSTKLLT
jgi:hypothetical protein